MSPQNQDPAGPCDPAQQPPVQDGGQDKSALLRSSTRSASQFPLDVAAIRERLAAATPGEWQDCGCGKCGLVWAKDGDCVIAASMSRHDEPYTSGDGVSHEAKIANAEFIAHAPADITALLNEIEMMRSVVR